jgi:phosphatidylglycerol---prolipoprotein diacylglyceryl transferase
MAFEALAYLVAAGLYVYFRRRFGDVVVSPIRWATVAVAIAGATIGSKLLFLLEDPQLTLRSLHDPAYLVGGKTIVGALALGLFSVEAMKRFIGLKQSTGDLYAIPLAVGIAIGRIGCFLTGLSDNTYGAASTLPWAIDFGDGVRRHPTQLYEIIFLLALVPFLYKIMRSAESETPSGRFCPGDAFKFFMVAYMFFRLVCDFIKPYPRLLLGLGGIQWACLVVLIYYSRDIARWLRSREVLQPASPLRPSNTNDLISQ